MEIIIDFPGGSKVDAHWGAVQCTNRPASCGVRADTVRDLSFFDWNLRRDLRAGLLQTARAFNGGNEDRPARVQQSDERHGGED